MSAHCLTHAGFVWLITGSALLGFAEFVIHWIIDALKCEGKTGFEMDFPRAVAKPAISPRLSHMTFRSPSFAPVVDA